MEYEILLNNTSINWGISVFYRGEPRDREVACSASDRQGSNFESCIWRAVSSNSSHHPQEVLLAPFRLYVHKCGLKTHSFHFISKQHREINLEIFIHYKLVIADS